MFFAYCQQYKEILQSLRMPQIIIFTIIATTIENPFLHIFRHQAHEKNNFTVVQLSSLNDLINLFRSLEKEGKLPRVQLLPHFACEHIFCEILANA